MFVYRLMEGVVNDLISNCTDQLFVLFKVWLLEVAVLTSPS